LAGLVRQGNWYVQMVAVVVEDGDVGVLFSFLFFAV